MTYQGHIENGKVVLDAAPALADGTPVVVTVVVGASAREEREPQSLYERMKPIIGIAKDLPPDASSRIDEILYGRRQNES